MNSEYKQIQDEILSTTKNLYAELKTTTDDHDERLMRIRTRIDDLEAEMRRPEPSGRKGNDGPGFNGYITPGRRLIEQKEVFDLLKKTSRVRVGIGNFWPNLEEKTLIDSAALGFSTPGILGAQRIESIVPLPRRRLTIRDLLRTRQVTAGQIDFIKEAGFTNAASPQAEGEAKGESANTFSIESERVRTIAHWIPLSKQAVDDLPELRRFVDENLLYGLKLKEETELLSGDNLGDHLNGIIPQATAYAGTYNIASDTKIDKLRHAILELADAEEECSGFVLHPKDYHDIELVKTEEGGANKGSYVVGDPLGGTLQVRTLWGRPCVVTRSITSGRFLAGNFAMAVIGDRLDATIDMSEEHSDYFTKNKIAVRAEERIALAVLRTTAFCYGAF